MSHRITTETDITDKSLAIQAANQAGWAFSEQGDSLRFTSGPMSSAVLNTKTGVVSGDSDYVRRTDESMGALKQFYAEAKYNRDVIQSQGHEVMERVVEKGGDIVLTCKAHFA